MGHPVSWNGLRRSLYKLGHVGLTRDFGMMHAAMEHPETALKRLHRGNPRSPPSILFPETEYAMDNQAAAYGDFLLGVFKNPKGVSALTPSSPSLARAIAREVDIERDGLVVELGPGTGAITNALLARGIAPDRMLLIESEPQFVQILRRLYPALDVRRGDALRLEHHLPPTSAIAAVVSGLPLLHFPSETRRDLIRRSLACQGPGGLFVQLSYGWRPPIPAEQGITIGKKTVWSNFPPAHIWAYRNS